MAYCQFDPRHIFQWNLNQTFSFKKMHLKVSPAKSRPFCPGLIVSIMGISAVLASIETAPKLQCYGHVSCTPSLQDITDIIFPVMSLITLKCNLVHLRLSKFKWIIKKLDHYYSMNTLVAYLQWSVQNNITNLYSYPTCRFTKAFQKMKENQLYDYHHDIFCYYHLPRNFVSNKNINWFIIR